MYNGLATQAVDGNHNGDFSKGSCSLTKVDEAPWWVVDLMSETEVVRVAITNRANDNGKICTVS